MNKVNAQQYFPFPDSNAVWREYYTSYAGGCYQDQVNLEYFLNGDTVINAATYHKVYRNHSWMLWPVMPGCGAWTIQYTANIVSAFIREDSSKHVYMITPWSTTEEIIYDFNQHAGDTLNSYLSATINIISSVDSVLAGTQYRKRYWISTADTTYPGGSNYTYIIEGIGSANGLLGYMVPFFESGGCLGCFTQDGQVLYTNANCTPCTPVNEINEKNTAAIHIFPNPVFNKLTIDHSSDEITVSLIDVRGRILIDKRKLAGNEKVLDVSELHPGLYILMIIDENGFSYSEKVFKQ